MTQVAEIIAREIARVGPISFARFMELALYCPVYGYYEKEGDNIGRRGDYYTSVSTGPLFGQLLACQFCEWLSEHPMLSRAAATVHKSHARVERCHDQRQAHHRTKDCSQPQTRVIQNQVQLSAETALAGAPDSSAQLQLVEAGAHDGTLARDILDWINQHRPQIFQRLQYFIVEPSRKRRDSQQNLLRNFTVKVQWVTTLAELAPTLDHAKRIKPGCIRGIIFSNELLDAMPVHRFGWDAGRRRWFEWVVTMKDDQFRWTRMENPAPLAMTQFEPCLDRLPPMPELPQDFTIEYCPAALEWWRDAASALAWGKLVTIDYGLLAEERLRPERPHGTLRGYQGHRLSANPLANPGEQDLTAHVDFSALQEAGEAAGLTTDALTGSRLPVGSQAPSQLEEKVNSPPEASPAEERRAPQEVSVLLTQEQFLTSIARRIWEGELEFEPWTARHTREFKTLTHPEHLGRAFRVLVQSRC